MIMNVKFKTVLVVEPLVEAIVCKLISGVEWKLLLLSIQVRGSFPPTPYSRLTACLLRS